MNNGHSSETQPRYYRPPASKAATGGETSLRRALRVLDRRKWTLLLVVAGFFTIAILIAQSRPVVYQSRASIEVGTETPLTREALLEAGGTGKVVPPWDNYFNTQIALLREPDLHRRVLESMPKADVEEFLDSADPVQKLGEHLKIEGVPSTFVIQIVLDHKYPSPGPGIVNKLVELYMQDSERRVRELVLGVAEKLEKETLPAIHQRVKDSEQALQQFVAKAGGGSLLGRRDSLAEQRRRLADRIFEIRSRQYGLMWDPRLEDLREEDAESILGSARLIESLLARRVEIDTAIARASAEYKDQHPRMIGLKNELEKISERLNESLGIASRSRDRRLRTESDRLKRRMEGADKELKALLEDQKEVEAAIEDASTLLAEHARLESEVAAARDIYHSYLKTQADVRAKAGAGVAAVRVVGGANQPTGRKKDTQLILSLGAVMGLLFGAAAVILAEQNDDRASMPYEAEEAVGLDVLVSVPRLSRPLGHRGPVLPKDHPLKSPLEPFRRLRAEVQARLKHVEGSRIIAVVGAGHGEGKSTVAVNLARVLGLEKRNVLLVDAEFRRPRLKAQLADGSKPGLEEYMRHADAHFRDCVQPTSFANVDVIGATKPMEEAPEMPGLQRFKELWQKARSFYDYVIVDAGPVNDFSEAAVAATNADASVLVMDERRSKLRNVLSARRLLENLQVRLLGLVVNRSYNPEAGGLISRYIAEVHASNNNGNGNGTVHVNVSAPEVASVSPSLPPIVVQPEESETMSALLNRVFLEFDETKRRAAMFESAERENNVKLEGELRKNVELSQKFTNFVESERGKEEEELKKLEGVLSKSLEGVNKKLTDLRLRAVAGGSFGGGGMEGDVQLRPSQATIDGIFSQKIESNIPTIEKPKEKKGGSVNSALDRLKNMRSNPPKKDEEKK